MTTTPRRTPMILAVTAIATLASLSACSDSGDTAAASEPEQAAAEPTTLEFMLDVENGDLEQTGSGKDAVGDHYYSAMTMLDDGDVAGRALLDCMAFDPTYGGQMCTGVLLLDGGTLSIQNAGEHEPIEGVDYGPESFAVTGGTGEYVGATGEMTVGESEAGPLTITLLPQTSN